MLKFDSWGRFRCPESVFSSQKNCTCEVEMSVEWPVSVSKDGNGCSAGTIPRGCALSKALDPPSDSYEIILSALLGGGNAEQTLQGREYFRWLSRKEQGSELSPSLLSAFYWRWLVCAWQDSKSLLWLQ